MHNPIVEKVGDIYTKEVAKKYHFVEAFLKKTDGQDERTNQVYQKKSKKSSLQKLLSSNMLDDSESIERLRSTHMKNLTNMQLLMSEQDQEDTAAAFSKTVVVEGKPKKGKGKNKGAESSTQ